MVLVRTDDWRYVLNSRPLETFLWLGGSNDVDTVVVDGVVLVSGGETVGVEVAEVRDRYLDALLSFTPRCLRIPSDVVAGVLSVARPRA